jgi:hypothetical protein
MKSCKSSAELTGMTVARLRREAARLKISLVGLKTKKEIIARILYGCQAIVQMPAIVPTQACLSKFTREGRPYKRACLSSDRGVLMESIDQPTALSTCDVHQVPDSTVTVELKTTKPVAGKGVSFLPTGEGDVLIDTVTQIEGDNIIIDMLKPATATEGIRLRRRFVFDKTCVVHRGNQLGGVVAVDSNKSVMLQLCDSDGKGCEKSLISIELLEGEKEQKAWSTQRTPATSCAGIRWSWSLHGRAIPLP